VAAAAAALLFAARQGGKVLRCGGLPIAAALSATAAASYISESTNQINGLVDCKNLMI
jgi:hypothetical protein